MTRVKAGWWTVAAAVFMIIAVAAEPVRAGPSGPPPEPPGYDMGVVTNGDFEAGGGSLDGWSGGSLVVGTGDAGYGTTTLGGNTAMRLYAHTGSVTGYGPGDVEAWCSQEIDIPVGATALEFSYFVTPYDWQYGSLAVTVVCPGVIGQLADPLSTCGNWVAMSLTIPESMKGRHGTLCFEVRASYDWDPEAYWGTGTDVDLWVDYVSLLPEPGSMGLLALGALGLVARRRAR